MRFKRIVDWSLGIGVCATCLACSPTPPADSSDGKQAEQVGSTTESGSAGMAYVMSKEFVAKCLKFPLDATFPWGPESSGYVPELDAWRVDGTVKAKNEFGAALTHNWSTLVYTKGGDAWECYAVTIDGEAQYISDAYKAKQEAMAAAERKRNEDAAKELESQRKTKAEQEAEAARKARVESRRRTWTDASGGFTVEAALLKRTPDAVTLQKEDGTTVDVPIEKLSEADKEYIKSLGH